MLLRSQSRQLLDMPSTGNRSKIMNTLPTPINIEPHKEYVLEPPVHGYKLEK